MSTPTVFLYNLDNPRGAKIRRLCMPLGLRTALVPRESTACPWGSWPPEGSPRPPMPARALTTR